MNTVAKYTPSHFLAEGNKKTKSKKKIVFHKDISTDKKPKKILLSQSIASDAFEKPLIVTYPIENILITDYNLIQKMNDTRIFLCIYQIKNNNHKAQFSYIEYLLYKYPSSIKSKKLADTFTFPYTVSKKNETSLVTANKLFYDITNGIYGKEEPLGFLEKENDLYFFYKTVAQGPIVEYYKSTQELWWVLIDEICNHQKIITYAINRNVTNLFYNNPRLIYLRDNEDRRLEIPSVGYIGAYWAKLPAIATSVDTVPNIEKFFGSFVFAVQQGGWTNNRKSLTLNGKEIANKKGKYTQGGVVRFAVFLNASYVVGVTDKDLEKYINNPNEWRNHFQSLFIGKIQYKKKIHSQNSHFKVTTFEQQLPLSYHWLDMNTLKKWNPSSTEYRIL